MPSFFTPPIAAAAEVPPGNDVLVELVPPALEVEAELDVDVDVDVSAV